MKNIARIILLTLIAFACSVNKKAVKSTIESTFHNADPKNRKLESIRYEYYSESLNASNELRYNENNELEYMEYDYGSPRYEKSLELYWQKQKQSNQSEWNEEGEFFISHSENDVGQFDLHVFYDGPEDHFLTREYYTDSFSYERTVELSEDVIRYYKGLKKLFLDSLLLHHTVPFPELKNCQKLISSTYKITECISFKDGLYKETIIDSSYYDGELEVEREELVYTHLKTLDEEGNLTIIYQDDRKHLRKYYLASDLRNPFSATESFIVDQDTFYTINLTTQFEKGLRCSKFEIKKKVNPNNSYGNLRLPIVSRETNIWRDKKGDIVRVHMLATTNQGHVLEYDKNNGEVVTNKVTIPEVSKDQTYAIGYDPLYRLEIYRFDKGPRKPKIEDKNLYYSELKEDLLLDYNRTSINRLKRQEVWLSKDSLVQLELIRY